MPSSVSPPVLSSLLWHCVQYWLTNCLTAARSSREPCAGAADGGAACCAPLTGTKPPDKKRAAIQQAAFLEARMRNSCAPVRMHSRRRVRMRTQKLSANVYAFRLRRGKFVVNAKLTGRNPCGRSWYSLEADRGIADGRGCLADKKQPPHEFHLARRLENLGPAFHRPAGRNHAFTT